MVRIARFVEAQVCIENGMRQIDPACCIVCNVEWSGLFSYTEQRHIAINVSCVRMQFRCKVNQRFVCPELIIRILCFELCLILLYVHDHSGIRIAFSPCTIVQLWVMNCEAIWICLCARYTGIWFMVGACRYTTEFSVLSSWQLVQFVGRLLWVIISAKYIYVGGPGPSGPPAPMVWSPLVSFNLAFPAGLWGLFLGRHSSSRNHSFKTRDQNRTFQHTNITSFLSKSKVTPSFCFAFKIPDNMTASSTYICTLKQSQVGMTDMVEMDLGVDPSIVFLKAFPFVINNVNFQTFTLLIQTLVELASKKLHTHNGENQPKH